MIINHHELANFSPITRTSRVNTRKPILDILTKPEPFPAVADIGLTIVNLPCHCFVQKPIKCQH